MRILERLFWWREPKINTIRVINTRGGISMYYYIDNTKENKKFIKRLFTHNSFYPHNYTWDTIALTHNEIFRIKDDPRHSFYTATKYTFEPKFKCIEGELERQYTLQHPDHQLK